MKKKKVDLFWVFVGFGLSYMLFGLTLKMDTYTDISKQTVGFGALISGLIFMDIGYYISERKDKN